MGNNTSIPNNVKRKSSMSKRSKDQTKSIGNHVNKQQKNNSNTAATQNLTIPVNTENGYPLPYKPKAIVSPNIFYENTADTDYFNNIDHNIDSRLNSTTSNSAASGSNNIHNNGDIMSGGSYEDDDYDIDEDLINKTSKNLTHSEYTDMKNVLIKFVNYDENLSQNHDAGHYEDINEKDKINQIEEDQVFIIGNFNEWSKKIKLHKDPNDGIYKIFIGLPFGIYKVKFLVNDDVRYSENLPIATDKSGNVVNWFEVDENDSNVFEAGIIEQDKIISNKNKSTASFHHNHHSHNQDHTNSQLSISEYQQSTGEYSQEIPVMFHQSDEILPVDEEFLRRNPIPELPIYLNNNVLNNHFNKHHNSNLQDVQLQKNKNNIISSGLNSHIIPHVNLNHLLTSNIKNNVLSVACTTRYSGKFITQIMYSPSGNE
ncbi:5'-AMP-activated protein kinase subunit beta-1 [Wickerhamomyces ciferrii]|uniref:5'-AMP-activated protein kinase subunit beta-1 n=1 Tax=Wickerhamomyces ciferrii (strain ATCC 14091 / BCRC 22168 / CBS 111 / JCM 3599 / NBRC 0793 / NRRL Y-1031 F-60-10) TaxID=1206466 RepID=K0KRR7_WICCF|nr:5'-AMP-activated protein kinase subunit beta-1 [Wickerhamomyces ciferrii]CCH45796.1 5'-AMP-activated protein kinase subunit beta-1 [Wickerhamomyces ciferrii]